MSTEKIELELSAANPISRPTLAALDLAAGEAALGEALVAESALTDGPRAAGRAPRRSRSALLLIAGAVVAAAGVAVVLLAGGATRSPQPAYGAELIRFAENSPRLLLEGPGWRIRGIEELKEGEGKIEFTKASPDPHPDESLMTRSDRKRGIMPAAVIARRQRRVELNWHDARQFKLLWHDGKLGTSFYDSYLHKRVRIYEHGHGFKTTIPALGVTAYVDPRAENAAIQGGPGDRLMVAIWAEEHHLLELRASVPDLAAFRERLRWLHRVDARSWLDAMPAKVVKAAEYGATVQEMLRGIPLPPGFDPDKIPDLGLTTDRYQVGAVVGGAVACGWFSRWGEARANHDAAGAREAEKVLLESETRWPIFREMSKEGGYPATVIEYAKAMPSGSWYGRPLLDAVDSEGGLCGPGDAGAPGR